MISFAIKSASRKHPGSHLALAIAMATSAALTVGLLAEPAHAQRNKKKDQEKAPKVDYSKGFVAVFTPLNEGLNADGADANAFKAQVPGLVAAVETPDDRMVAGQTVYNIGVNSKDPVLQLQGAEMMLASGKVAPDKIGQYNFLAAQLAYGQELWGKAREYATTALENGYSQNSPELIVSEAFFSEGQIPQGLDYLRQAIQNRIDAGQVPPSDWLRRGLTQAYNNKLAPQSDDYSVLLVEYYPDSAIWGDTIAIQRNLKGYEGGELLDLLRLSRRVDALRTERDYEDYVQTADARKLPGEVDAVISEGKTAGTITGSNLFITEAGEEATGRIRADKADLPALEKEAQAGSADLRSVVAAGDVFLSYDDFAKAERFYTKALSMPGVDQATILNRLGIAQLEQGKHEQALKSFGQVEGARQPIARLWSVYARQTMGPKADTTVSNSGDTM